METTKDWKNYVIGVAVLFLAAAIIALIIQDAKLSEARINSKQYEEQLEELETREDELKEQIAARDKTIAKLRKEYEQTPKDNEVIINNPIEYVTADSEWSEIIKPIRAAIDSFSRKGSPVPD